MVEVGDGCVALQEVVADVVAVVFALVECLRGGAIARLLSLLDGGGSCRDSEDASPTLREKSLFVERCA